MKYTKRETDRILSRLSETVTRLDKMDSIDREYILSRERDKRPWEFYKVARLERA